MKKLLFVVPVLLFVLSGCEYSEVDGIGSRTADADYPPQHDLTSFDPCTPGELGQWRFSGQITNNAPQVSTYELTVAFYDGTVRLDEASTWVRDLKPGEVAQVNDGRWVQGGDRVTSCEVLTINRWS